MLNPIYYNISYHDMISRITIFRYPIYWDIQENRGMDSPFTAFFTIKNSLHETSIGFIAFSFLFVPPTILTPVLYILKCYSLRYHRSQQSTWRIRHVDICKTISFLTLIDFGNNNHQKVIRNEI